MKILLIYKNLPSNFNFGSYILIIHVSVNAVSFQAVAIDFSIENFKFTDDGF